MNAVKIWNCVTARLARGLIVALVWAGLTAHAALEETFAVLQIGTHTYKNVTVTTKAKDYIFILHSAGMANIKVRDLTPELRAQLGYGTQSEGEAKKPGLSWLKNATSALEKREGPRLGQAEQQLHEWKAEHADWFSWTGRGVWLLSLVCLVIHLSFCVCMRAICVKAEYPPGLLIWLPGLQWLPLMRAAGMSVFWFVVSIFPVFNLIAYIVWSVRIVQVLEKSWVITLLLLVPGLNLLAGLYLAFSRAPKAKEAPVVEIMTLDAA